MTTDIKRKTKETDIDVRLKLYGKGKSKIETGIPFFDHMLTLFAKHGFFDLTILAKGDIDIDFHHTVEDVGIALGMAFKDALGKVKGIRRYGFFAVPMDEALAEAAVDICGRSNLVYNVEFRKGKVGEFDTELAEAFFKGFVDQSFITLHLSLRYGKNMHHCLEAVFKAFARALSMAVEEEKRHDVPSTKGVI
ncbi:MAG: imidazoleglycerol-phosphate dehydratase HisB [bacterium]